MRKVICDNEPYCKTEKTLDKFGDLPETEVPWFSLTRDRMTIDDDKTEWESKEILPRVDLEFCSIGCVVNYCEDNAYKLGGPNE